MDAHSIPPTYPFHVARAYSPAAQPTRSAPQAKSIDSVELSRSKPTAKGFGALVAGKVAVAPNFNAAPPAANAESLSIYRHPADKNAAATGVTLGRSVDVNA